MAQLWEYSTTAGAYCITGSTFGVNSKILSANLVRSAPFRKSYSDDSDDATSKCETRDFVLLQVVKRDSIVLQVHQLNKKPSFVQTLVLPPASSGPGPYTIYTRNSEKYMAVVTKTGTVTLFSLPEFRLMPLSGLETGITNDGLPLFDLSGRWLVYTPVGSTGATNNTPLELPEQGLFLDRILENISTTTAASLKSLSDAGVAGIRHYLSKDQQSSKKVKRSGNAIYVGSSKFDVDSSGRIGAVGGSPIGSSLPAALTSSFYTQAKPQPIQIIDLETQSTVCTFISPQGLSFLSLSPHDAVLATVSARGECVFTFDLSFVPRQVTLTGKYVRGKTPGKVTRIEWDSEGGFGILTRGKGSVHWFERQPWNIYESQVGSISIGAASSVASNTPFNKLWRLSGWNVSNLCTVPDYIGNEPEHKGEIPLISPDPSSFSPASVLSNMYRGSSPVKREAKYNKLLMLREGEILIVDRQSGNCAWKYELPSVAVSEPLLTPVLPIIEGECPGDTESDDVDSSIPEYRDFNSAEPLSFYEIETFLPYPFIHTDRHVILSTYENYDIVDFRSDAVFGKAIKSKELDFGRARGQVNFDDTGVDIDDEEDWQGQYDECGGLLGENDAIALASEIPPEKAKELRMAMESMVIDH